MHFHLLLSLLYPFLGTQTGCQQLFCYKKTLLLMFPMLYARFEASNTEACMRASAGPDDCVITLSVADMSKTYKQVNIHKAAGPDGLQGRVLRACADQLAGVFTDIFNMSLIESITNMLQADHHSPCAQEH